MIHLICAPADFRPPEVGAVRWLERDADYTLARDLWATRGQGLSEADWCEAHDLGYTYAAIVEDGKIIACTAVWRYSEQSWEVAAVMTREGYRRHGYAKQVVAFVTAYILQQGHRPTCTTQDDNVAMLATARSVGFQVA
jgi:predicted GNAT family acetyltransferase